MDASDEAVRRYLPLVRWLVQRLATRKPPQVEIDEMVSWGIEGLLDALKKYDPSKQAAFETYAQFRIRGAILDRLRGMDWVSRSVRQKASQLEKTYQQIEAKRGRPATEEEAAEADATQTPREQPSEPVENDAVGTQTIIAIEQEDVVEEAPHDDAQAPHTDSRTTSLDSNTTSPHSYATEHSNVKTAPLGILVVGGGIAVALLLLFALTFVVLRPK